MPMKFDYSIFLQEGKLKELEFAKDLVNSHGGTCRPSTEKQDIFNHIDLFWKYADDKCTSFDVKGLKKANRSDNYYSPDIEWVEVQNVNGYPGWLYGKEDYIAFEMIDEWIIIRRTELAKLIEENVIDKTITNDRTKNLVYYQRNGRQDIIVKVPTHMIKEKSCKIIKKEIIGAIA